MRPNELVVRCFAQQKGDVWEAFCLDLNLAAQGDDLDDVKVRLDDMINSYVYDALVGDDCDYAGQLMSRKAPMGFWIKYYWLKACNELHCAKCTLFDKVLPLVPARL